MSDAKAHCQTEVFFDGSCPLCRREISLYQDIADGERVAFVDISDPATPPPAELSRDKAMARFHVRRNGELKDGAAAFVALWADLPGWRWLARLAAVPGVTPLLELAYRAFLPVRPYLQRLFRARSA